MLVVDFSCERRYCDFCHGAILYRQKHIQTRAPGTNSRSRFDFRHYHYRFKGDCWQRRQRRTGLPSADASAISR